jgi:predicted nuclease of predicted toxin-antitoxin system
MKLYVDDDSVRRQLVSMLRKAGHWVVIPADVGMVGRSDARHLLYAVQQPLVVLTRNHDDFEDLHLLVTGCGGHHPGILVTCEETDPARNMSVRAIVTAVGKLERSGFVVADQFVILNHWQ